MNQRNIIIILTFSCIVTIAWVIFAVHHASVSGTLTTSVIEQIIPITPTFDQSVIDETKTRQPVDPIYDIQGVSPTTTPPVSLTPNPQANSTNATGSATSL